MSENAILGFGAMRLPVTDKNNPATIDMEEFTKMVDYYMDQGFDYFDTSYAYHNEKSEEALKKALIERYPRESYRIADKMPTWLLTNPEDNERLFNIMLERLGIDYFDVFLIHNINRAFYPLAENSKTFEFIKKMKDEGKAHKIGFSFHDKADLLEEVLEKYGDIIDVVQIQLNFLDWNDPRVQSHKCKDLCVKYGVDIIVMEPIKGGTLTNISKEIKEVFDKTGETIPDLALRFAASRDNVSVVLSGMNNIEQMKENCETFKVKKPFTNGDYSFLLDMAEAIRKNISIPCSFCGYCTKDCPANIPIPDFFNLYNTETMYSLEANHALCGITSATYAPASECIECGNCVDICTQNLNIPELLKDVVKLFEG